MIIKSLSRKEPSYGQLVRYIEAGSADDRARIHHNLFVRSPEDVVIAFKENGTLMAKRKNGVMLYHEILSITRASGLDTETQKELLAEIVRRYLMERAPHCLAYGALHEDKANNLHYHLAISANAAGGKKRHRLSKGEFRRVQRDLERRVLDQYPELEQARAIDKRAERKRSQGSVELERKIETLPQVEAVTQSLTHAFANAGTMQELHQMLTDASLQLYRRGKSIGAINLETGRRHRLKTLGVMDDLTTAIKRIEERTMVNRPHGSANDPAERKPTMLDHAIDEVTDTIDQTLQLGADIIRGPDMSPQVQARSTGQSMADQRPATPSQPEQQSPEDQRPRPDERQAIAEKRRGEIAERRQAQDRPDQSQDNQNRSRRRLR